jgi:hypothetical protein
MSSGPVKKARRPPSYFDWKKHPDLVEKLKKILGDTPRTDQWWADRLSEVLGRPFTRKQLERFKANYGIESRVKRLKDKSRERRSHLRKMWESVHKELEGQVVRQCDMKEREHDIRECWADWM